MKRVFNLSSIIHGVMQVKDYFGWQQVIKLDITLRLLVESVKKSV